MKLPLNRIIAITALALMLAFAIVSTAQTTPPAAQAARCATASVALNTSNPKPGAELMATVSVENCSAAKEALVIKYSYTDPCGETTKMGTATLRLAPGETQPAQINFLAPAASSCAGAFQVTALITAAGQDLTTASAPFSVRAE